MAPRTSRETLEALRLITQEGYTAYQAAKATGISRSTISQNRQYREFMERKNHGQKRTT